MTFSIPYSLYVILYYTYVKSVKGKSLRKVLTKPKIFHILYLSNWKQGDRDSENQLAETLMENGLVRAGVCVGGRHENQI